MDQTTRVGVDLARQVIQVHRIAFGPRAGQKVLTLRGAMPREDRARQPLCADIDGFSLHAAVRVEAHDRKRLEQLCSYITRPSLSDERVQLSSTPRHEADFRCNSQGRPISSVGEVREAALPATSSLSTETASAHRTQSEQVSFGICAQCNPTELADGKLRPHQPPAGRCDAACLHGASSTLK